MSEKLRSILNNPQEARELQRLLSEPRVSPKAENNKAYDNRKGHFDFDRSNQTDK